MLLPASSSQHHNELNKEMSQNLRQLSAGAAKTIKVLSTGLKCWLISGRYEACQPYTIRLLCCQLVTQREQKLLNEKVGGFHPVKCLCLSGPCEKQAMRENGEGSKGGWESHQIRIQIWPWVRREDRKEAIGWKHLRLKFKGKFISTRLLRSQRLLSQDSCFSKEQTCLWVPATLSHWQEQPVGSVASIKMGQQMSEHSSWGSPWTVPLAAQAWLCALMASTAHTCSTPQIQGNLLHCPHGPLFLRKILNNVNNLNFE